MTTLKRILMWLSNVGLQFVLGVWILVSVLVMVFGSPQPLKNTLDAGKAYETVLDFALEQVQVNQEQGAIPLETATIQELAKEVFPPEKLRAHTENFLDGMYDWLNGETDKPEFTIDLRDARKIIASGVAQKSVNKLEDLPACTNSEQFSGLENASCKPKGLDLSSQESKIEQEILASKDFLPDTVLTGQDLKDPQTGQPFAEANPDLPNQFQLAKIMPYIIGAIGMILVGVILFTATSKKQGLLILSRSFLASGGSVLFAAIVFGLLLPNASQSYAENIAGQNSPPVAELLKEVVKTLSLALAKAGGLVFVLGAAMFIGTHYIKDEDQSQKPPKLPVKN